MGDLRFDGEVVVVTGAGAGLGRAHALALAGRGARVVVNDVSAKRAGQVVAEIETAGGVAIADEHRIGSSVDALGLVAHALDVFGRVDMVLNNAGMGSTIGEFTSIDDDSLETVVTTHLLGTFRVARAAWPHLAGGGRILNTASMAFVGADSMAAYSMAKGGIVSLTRSLAIEGATRGTRVNAIVPIGYTWGASLTPDPEVRAWMQSAFPCELATPGALWLLHRDCSVNGEVVVSAGGRVALVSTSSVPGLQLGADATPEAVRDRWSEVMATGGSVALHHTRQDMAHFTGEQTWRS